MIRVFVSITLTVLTSSVFAENTVAWTNPGTLVLVAYGQDGFAVAADGGTLDASGKPKEIRKVFQIGNAGVIAFVGYVEADLQSAGALQGKVDVTSIAQNWISEHKDAGITEADHGITTAISDALNQLFSGGDTAGLSGQQRFRLIFAGFDPADNHPSVIREKFFEPAANKHSFTVERKYDEVSPGVVFAFGKWLIQEELISGESAALQTYKAEPSMRYVRRQFANHKREAITVDEWLACFDVILRATESDEGKLFDPDPAYVGPPNIFAKIRQKTGVEWTKPVVGTEKANH